MNVIQDNLSKTRQNLATNKQMIVKPTVIGDSLMKPPTNNVRRFVTPLSNRSRGQEVCTSATKTNNTKSSSSRTSSNTIISLCEGRGKASRTIGLAALNISYPTLILCELSDTQTYTSTLTKLNILHPSEILIPSTFVENANPSRLVSTIIAKYPTITITSLSRSEYNRSRGLSLIEGLCAPVFSAVLSQIKEKFYSLAASCALLRYIEQVRRVSFYPGTIKVCYQELEDTVLIDVDTAELLELVSNAGVQKVSLFSILNYCSTNAGKKLLRVNILQPLCNRNLIETRLDCVQELLDSPNLLVRLTETLKPLADIEACLALGTILPTTSATVSERQLNYTLQLKGLLTSTLSLTNELKVTKHPVFKDIYSRLDGLDTRKKILNIIATMVNDDAYLSKGHAGELQRCFAIKTGVNGFLDLSRRLYTEGVDKMRAYVDELSDTYNLPLRVQHTIKNGFHIILPMTKALRNLKKSDLPDVFFKIERYSSHYYLTTMEMINYDKRLKNTSTEIQNISNVIIYKLLVQVQPFIGDLYQLCDDIALLDLLVSLAKASSLPNYVRPCLTESYMDLEELRHPLLETVADQELTTNSVYAYPRANLHIITGPNMSGKSILLRSICLIQVLGQLGCWVPCSKAILRPADRIFARVAEDDSLIASSFALEISKLGYILHTLTNRSLVILDEPCRTTACGEGVALAIAFCERLIKSNCFSFVATHFISLTLMEQMYPCVKNWHLETLEEYRANNTRISLKFTYRLLSGVTNIDSYGIKLSRIFNSSKSISDRAEALYNYLLPIRKSLTSESTSSCPKFLKFRLQSELDYLKIKNKLTEEIQKNKIAEFELKTGLTFELSNSLLIVSSPSQDNRKTSSSSSTKEQKISSNSLTQSLSYNNTSHKFSIPESNKINTSSNQESNYNKHIFSFDTNDINDENNFEQSKNINSQLNAQTSQRNLIVCDENYEDESEVLNLSAQYSLSDENLLANIPEISENPNWGSDLTLSFMHPSISQESNSLNMYENNYQNVETHCPNSEMNSAFKIVSDENKKFSEISSQVSDSSQIENVSKVISSKNSSQIMTQNEKNSTIISLKNNSNSEIENRNDFSDFSRTLAQNHKDIPKKTECTLSELVTNLNSSSQFVDKYDLDNLSYTSSPILTSKGQTTKFNNVYLEIQNKSNISTQNPHDINNISTNSSPVLNTNKNSLISEKKQNFIKSSSETNDTNLQQKSNSINNSLEICSPILTTKKESISINKQKSIPQKICLVSTLYESSSSSESDEEENNTSDDIINENEVVSPQTLTEEIFSSYLLSQKGITSTPIQRENELHTSPNMETQNHFNQVQNSSLYFSRNLITSPNNLLNDSTSKEISIKRKNLSDTNCVDEIVLKRSKDEG